MVRSTDEIKDSATSTPVTPSSLQHLEQRGVCRGESLRDNERETLPHPSPAVRVSNEPRSGRTCSWAYAARGGRGYNEAPCCSATGQSRVGRSVRDRSESWNTAQIRRLHSRRTRRWKGLLGLWVILSPGSRSTDSLP